MSPAQNDPRCSHRYPVSRMVWFLGFGMIALVLASCGQLYYGHPGMGMPSLQGVAAIRETPAGEAYNAIVENPFLVAATNPLSTFSIDVDTASYSNVRRYLLQQKQLPPADAVRIEELVNYFDYNYPEPSGEHPIGISTEVAAAPWDDHVELVRIGIQAKRIAKDNMPARNLVFLIDTSGSMQDENKLPLVKSSLKMLVNQMRSQDRVAIVSYAGNAGLVLGSTAGNKKSAILNALNRLEAGGSTNGGEGLKLAYRTAQENFIAGGINRVLIATDGDFNVGVTSQEELVSLIETQRKTGIYLSVLGYGFGNLKDGTLEKIAHHGNGHYAYIDSQEEAQQVFVEHGGAMYTVANDVKIQVEFNPAKVSSYRLLGYENRLMKHEEFKDDTKDAGDMGSGHTVTALYAVVPISDKFAVSAGQPLRYRSWMDYGLNKELLTVKVRYKHPGAETGREMMEIVPDDAGPFARASTDFRFAAAVASFGMLLRESKHKGAATYARVEEIAREARGPDRNGQRAEFVQMVEAAQRLEKRID